MTNTTKPSKKDLIAAAFAYVYPDAEALIKDVAKEHTIANMGQNLEDFIVATEWLEKNPQQLVGSCYNSFYDQSESEEMAEGIEDERKSWLKQAKKDVALVQKKGLPLTLENVRLAFEKKGPFERKSKK